MTTLLRIFALFGFWACMIPIAAEATSDAFPSKPVRIIVPTSGGMNDVIPRLIGPKLAEALGQPVVVEVRAGAAGIIAAEYVAKSAPDGYTLLLGYPGPLAIQVALTKLSYDPALAFAPITLIGEYAQFLVVHPSVPASNVSEFISYAKAHPRKLNYASTGSGGAGHLLMELFKVTTGADLVHIPYKGAAPAIVGLLAGQAQVAFLVVANVLPHVKSGRLKALAIAGPSRIASTPEVPTLAQSGFPGFESGGGWLGILAPSETPKPIVERYHRELVRILNLPEIRTKLESLDVIASTPEEFGLFIRAEISKWRKIVKQTGTRAH